MWSFVISVLVLLGCLILFADVKMTTYIGALSNSVGWGVLQESMNRVGLLS